MKCRLQFFDHDEDFDNEIIEAEVISMEGGSVGVRDIGLDLELKISQVLTIGRPPIAHEIYGEPLDIFHEQLKSLKYNKHEKSDEMSVKVKKQLKPITIDDLRNGVEFEELRVTINKDKRTMIENQFGIKYDYENELRFGNAELLFTDYIMEVYAHSSYYPIPFEMIEKLEVRE